MATWGELRGRGEHALRLVRASSPVAEAQWILEAASGMDRVELLSAAAEPVPRTVERRVEKMLARRCAGEPLQYVLRSWSFRDLDLLVDPRVLIPRPETETTVQVAIDEAARFGARVGRRNPWAGTATAYPVADLGTGSGAIALALVSELPDAEVWATDVSDDALVVARANLAGAGSIATRVRVVGGSWFDALPESLAGELRLVVSNPPYVAEDEVADLPPEVAKHEPREALVSGPTGFEAIETIVAMAPRWLAPRLGVLVVELAPHQGNRAVGLARDAGFATAFTRPDLAGRDRVLVARMAG